MTAVRFSSIGLAPYGIFEDRTFAFARPKGPDLHLVIGRNEAGKTTLKHALIHALFGIPRGNAYGFRGTPRLSAELTIGSANVRVDRAGASRTLKDKAVAAVLDAALRAADVTADTFLLSQAFSHDEMREHADALFDQSGDLRTLLEKAAGGLVHVESVKRGLEKDLASLFVRHKGNKQNLIRQLEARREAADARYQAARLDTGTYAQLMREVSDAEAAQTSLRRALEEARAEVVRHTRIRDHAGTGARLVAIASALNALPRTVMAPGAVARVGALLSEEAIAAAEVRRLTADVARETTARDAVIVDADILAAAGEIEALATRAAAMPQHDARRGECRDNAAAARLAAIRRAADVGLAVPEGDVARLAENLPPAIDRNDARRTLAERAEHDRAVQTAAAALARAEEITPPDAPEPPPEPLVRALDEIARLGDYGANLQMLDAAVDAAEGALAAATRAAAADPVADNPPADTEGVRREKAIDAAREDLRAAEAAVEAARLDHARRKAAVDAHRALKIPSSADIEAARTGRDTLWREIVAGRPLAEAAAPYEAEVSAADKLADERFVQSKAVATAEQLRVEAREAQSILTEREAARDARCAVVDDLVANWTETLAGAGLSPVPQDYAAWHRRRADRADAARSAADATRRRDAFSARMKAAVDASVAALGETGDEVPAAELDRLAAQTRAAMAAAQRAEAEAKAAHKAFATEQANLPRLREVLAQSEAERAAWRTRWEGLAARCNLEADITPARLDDLFDAYGDIVAAAKQVADGTAEAERITRFEDALADDAARLGRALGVAADAYGPVVAALRARLTEARDAERRRMELTLRLDTAVADRDTAVEARARVRSGLAADIDAAGLAQDAPSEALAAAAEASDRRRALHAERDERLSALEIAGLSPESLAEALKDTDDAGRATALAGAEDRLNQAEAAERAANDEAVRARQELHRSEEASREGTAARARMEHTAIERETAEAAAAAIRLRLELAVLSAAQDLFAREYRSPILERASAVFAGFTGGAYDRIEAGTGDDAFVLAHRVDDDIDVNVRQMSAGTRDQLVASVRFAAAQDSALPFIADDLFVNADDARAAHGFRALANLAEGRQVFYLTHHDHLEAVARDAISSEINVVKL
ncbi:AAA family ATPase [Acuticoccus sp. MNP-M23]|uniref:AAA family ATPase n=1 Tax=Acuticoccus sp. MNP-M23 TaxID=3072793 RepID=UPI0028155293|nr:AAA family ATPase [Acuticoccus sp. MNP-M23]WMS42437.1 AAA family ATPase [Acuticoccus sp. MNP-M23]